MRKCNAVISVLLLVMFLVHMAAGIFKLSGVMPGGGSIMTGISHTMLCLIAVHIIIGVKLTADSVAAVRKSGASYFKENRLFWIKRISGFAVLLFVVCHVVIFLGRNDEAYRLNYFGGIQLISQLLMVLSLAVHILTNIKPLMLSLGIGKAKSFLADALIVAAVLLLVSAAGFVIYYIRWSIM